MKPSELKEGYLYRDNSKRGWCKNGTFIVRLNDGAYPQIADTYWGNEWHLAMEEDVANFEEVLKFDDYTRVNGYASIKEYNEEDYIQAHFSQSSGRVGGNPDYFIRKGAKKNKNKQIAVIKDQIGFYERRIESLKKELETLQKEV